MKITDVFIREKLKHPRGESGPQQFRTSFKWRKSGGHMVSGCGETQEAADLACLEKIRERFRGSYKPLWLNFRGETILVWRDGDQWAYGHVREHCEPVSLCVGYQSRDDAERAARFSLAMGTWDNQEEESPIILHPDDQIRFRDWARHQKLFTAQYQRLQEVGWMKDEAVHILSGVNPDPARVKELGSPWPLLREMESTAMREGSE